MAGYSLLAISANDINAILGIVLVVVGIVVSIIRLVLSIKSKSSDGKITDNEMDEILKELDTIKEDIETTINNQINGDKK